MICSDVDWARLTFGMDWIYSDTARDEIVARTLIEIETLPTLLN